MRQFSERPRNSNRPNAHNRHSSTSLAGFQESIDAGEEFDTFLDGEVGDEEVEDVPGYEDTGRTDREL